jgi:ATP-dependent helicase/nuclease subunit B
MQTRVAPYGTAGWNEKVRIVEKIFSKKAGPPFLYNDVLFIVPSSRLRRTYGRLFLDIAERTQRTGAIVPPDIQTLSQLFQRLYRGLGGPALIDENSRLILFEGIVKELITATGGFGGQPDLLAPSLSTSVASMVEELSSSGVGPERLASTVAASESAGKRQVTLLIKAYERYERILADKGLVDPAGMLDALANRFDPAWLAGYRTVIIDGIHHASELQARVLRTIAAHADCTLFVDAASLDSIHRAGEYHPLRLVKELLANIGASGGVVSASADDDERFLADALFSDRSFDQVAKSAPGPDAFGRDLRLISAVNTREEVSWIASEVKRSLRNGTAPDSILVAFPSLDEYGPLMEEVFSDFGIPFNRALGRQLSSSPVATSLISLLTTSHEDFSGPSLLRVFSSPFLKFAEDRSLTPALGRFLRERRITGGKDRILYALKRHTSGEEGTDVLTAPLSDLAAALRSFSEPGPAALTIWMERLNTLTVWSGMAGRVGGIPGAFNINLQAYRKLEETLASLGRAGILFPEYQYSFSEWLFLLKKTFMHTRFQVPPEDEGGVQVLGMEESMGRAWAEIYVGGLIDGKFPQRLPQNIFLPEATLETLGVRTLENARLNSAYQFYRLLLAAPRVSLTWPAVVGDKPMVQSPFLSELTPLIRAKLLKPRSNERFSLSVRDSRSVPELAKAISRMKDIRGLESILAADQEGLAGIKSALELRPPDRSLPVVSPDQTEFSVTELDNYLRCPYDYYVKHRIRIAPLEEVTEDITALDRGSKVHAILKDFYEQWKGPVTAADREKARELLASLAQAGYGREADTFRNRREHAFFLNTMAERFLDAETALDRTAFRPVRLEWKIESFTLTLADGTAVELHGKIDRIDADQDGNFVVIDYKTGTYPEAREKLEQEIFQLPVYAVMALAVPHGSGTPLRKAVGLAYYDLSGRTADHCRDMVLYDKDALPVQPASKPNSSRKSPDDLAAILDLSMADAKNAIAGIRAGNFSSAPRDPKKCRFCVNEVLCGRTDEDEE